MFRHRRIRLDTGGVDPQVGSSIRYARDDGGLEGRQRR
jgi:hypothetical protein